jgi:glutamate N-acetyltransferase/amino-acid N-acetyltransferase
LRLIDESLQIYLSDEEKSGPETDRWQIQLQGKTYFLANDLRFQGTGLSVYAGHVGVCQHGRQDFTVIKFDTPSSAAAVFTTNKCAADCIPFNRKNLIDGKIQLLCVVSKNANVCTPHGAEHTEMIAAALAREFSVDEHQVFISFTGVIGRALPIERILSGISGLSDRLERKALERAAVAIMTTDRQAKYASIQFGEHLICGIAKGAGMIEPNMATMLSYIFTTVDLSPAQLKESLRIAVNKSFHCMSIDSDTSTSDTVALFASGETKLDDSEQELFHAALTVLCMKLARDIVGQGEGVTKIIEAEVALDTSEHDARLIAKQIVNSPLMKTAINGADPNWGRIVMAIGKPNPALQLTDIPRELLHIEIMNQCVFQGGHEVPVDLKVLSNDIREAKTVPIFVRIGSGKYRARVWGADLSKEYVEINADYTT